MQNDTRFSYLRESELGMGFVFFRFSVVKGMQKETVLCYDCACFSLGNHNKEWKHFARKRTSKSESALSLTDWLYLPHKRVSYHFAPFTLSVFEIRDNVFLNKDTDFCDKWKLQTAHPVRWHGSQKCEFHFHCSTLRKFLNLLIFPFPTIPHCLTAQQGEPSGHLPFPLRLRQGLHDCIDYSSRDRRGGRCRCEWGGWTSNMTWPWI